MFHPIVELVAALRAIKETNVNKFRDERAGFSLPTGYDLDVLDRHTA
jgi:hypothetical protein